MLSNNGVKALAKSLFINNTLIMIDLSNNSVGIEGIIKVAEGIKKNKGLNRLYLCNCYLANNNIGEEGAQILSQAIVLNSNLKILSLCFNKKGIVVSMILQSNIYLKLLNQVKVLNV